VTTRARWRCGAVVGIAAFAAAVGAVAIAACEPSSNATAYTPYQGIDVPSSLVTNGVGCSGGDAGISYFATVLANQAVLPDGALAPADDASPPGTDAGCGALPAATDLVPGAASIVACFTANASFELDGAPGPLDVWLFGYAGGTPANVACTDPTCPLSADGVATLFADQLDPATRATRTFKCAATPEVSQHPEAHGCIECVLPATDAGASADADAAEASTDAADVSTDAADASTD
jgi:hypothetical protein